MDTQPKWKSPVLWLTIIVTVAGALLSSGIFTSDLAVRIISGVAAVGGAILGIINNPNSNTSW